MRRACLVDPEKFILEIVSKVNGQGVYFCSLTSKPLTW